MIRSFYLTERELGDLKRMAAEQGVTVNTLMRIAVRIMLGLDVPEWALDLREGVKS